MSLIEPATAHRIAVFWGREDLLGKAIENTLASAGDWQLVKIASNFDARTCTHEIERLKPELLFLSLDSCSQEVPLSMQAMENNPKLRIIVINPCSNRIEIFSRKVIWIHEMADLLSIINDTPDIPSEGGNDKK